MSKLYTTVTLRLILVRIDEVHQGGKGHWESFRPEMMKGSASLRLYGVPGCPTLAMTATATDEEIKQVVKALGLRNQPVILTSSPIQSHFKFSVIRRPSNNLGLDGIVSSNGVKKPGLMDLLFRVYLRKEFIKGVKVFKGISWSFKYESNACQEIDSF